MSGPDWKQYDKQRARPRVTLTLSPEGREAAERVAAARGLSLSSTLEALAIEEDARIRAKKSKK